MTTNKTIETDVVLAELLEKVLRNEHSAAHSAGWDVRRLPSGDIQIGAYETPPEVGGEVEPVATIPEEYLDD